MFRGELENAAMELMISPFFERGVDDDRGYDFLCVNLGRTRWKKEPIKAFRKELADEGTEEK